jgi:hypothetical protein
MLKINILLYITLYNPLKVNGRNVLPKRQLTFNSSTKLYGITFHMLVCLLICLTDSNELFFVVILVLSYLLVSLVPY